MPFDETTAREAGLKGGASNVERHKNKPNHFKSIGALGGKKLARTKPRMYFVRMAKIARKTWTDADEKQYQTTFGGDQTNA